LYVPRIDQVKLEPKLKEYAQKEKGAYLRANGGGGELRCWDKLGLPLGDGCKKNVTGGFGKVPF